MNRLVILAFLVSITLSGQVGAEQRTIEVEMSDLVWEYSDPQSGFHEGSATYSIAPTPTSIDSAFVRFVGTAELGVLECPELVDWAFQLTAWFSVPGSSVHRLASKLVWESGQFDLTAELLSFGEGASLDFLLEGTGTVELEGFSAVTICPVGHSYSLATVESVYLLVEGDFLVATETSSWGGIKCLYR